MRAHAFDPRRDDVTIAMVRPPVQRMAAFDRGALARRQDQPVEIESPQHETFAAQRLEQRRHLRALKQGERAQMMTLVTARSARRPKPAAPGRRGQATTRQQPPPEMARAACRQKRGPYSETPGEPR